MTEDGIQKRLKELVERLKSGDLHLDEFIIENQTLYLQLPKWLHQN